MKKRANFPRPKIRVYPNGKATLSGLTATDLRSLLTAASLHRYDNPPKPKPEPRGSWLDEIKLRNWYSDQAWHTRQNWIVDSLLNNFTRTPRTPRHLLSKAERMRIVKENRELDALIEEMCKAKRDQNA